MYYCGVDVSPRELQISSLKGANETVCDLLFRVEANVSSFPLHDQVIHSGLSLLSSNSKCNTAGPVGRVNLLFTFSIPLPQ